MAWCSVKEKHRDNYTFTFFTLADLEVEGLILQIMLEKEYLWWYDLYRTSSRYDRKDV